MQNSTIITASYNEVINVDFTSDAWFNATNAAKQFNKRPNDWLNLDCTKSYIKILHAALFPEKALPVEMVVKQNQLVRTQNGGTVEQKGTWLHPELAVEFARWLSVGFSIWCNTTIRKILRGESIGQLEPVADYINNPSTTTRINDKMQQRLADGVYKKSLRLNKTTQWGFANLIKKPFGVNSYRDITLDVYPKVCASLGIEPLKQESTPSNMQAIPNGYELIETKRRIELENTRAQQVEGVIISKERLETLEYMERRAIESEDKYWQNQGRVDQEHLKKALDAGINKIFDALDILTHYK